MDKWEAIGGHNVNGKYTRAGEADIQGGWPISHMVYDGRVEATEYSLGCDNSRYENRLLYLAVEVKTEVAYNQLEKKWKMLTVDGVEQYQLDKSFKGREILQAAKINDIRRKGGLALFAWSFEQVEQYVKDNT